MANISYTKKENNTGRFTKRQGKKYVQFKSDLMRKEKTEKEAQKTFKGLRMWVMDVAFI